ncbi:hypothetical protein JRC04_04705 [Mycolicibacterium sp. S2-37]|uniref:hypothetical protein n=1 Tax=Mycolicibacterium sp. S2-37 TaxID=2810297 RepID=UPI001A94075C|nr:hypothetical protein [Mycolicibacterium sp. S2-37]MBO0676759.1 hypothetical protein [Mycolicibacterium sp. S2-37]
MNRNIELLEQTMQHIEDHPEQHYQQVWVSDRVLNCGTVACFAGWGALLSGMSVDEVHDAAEKGLMHTVGAGLFGLSENEAFDLFYSHNSPDVLRLMVRDLVNGDPLRDPYVYRQAVHA